MTPFDEAVERSLPGFLERQRWFGGKGRAIRAVTIDDVVDLAPEGGDALVICGVAYADGVRDRYLLLLGARQDPGRLPAVVRPEPGQTGWIVECTGDAASAGRLLAGFAAGARLPTRRGGVLEYGDTGDRARRVMGDVMPPVTPVGAEQSNTSLRVGREFIFKLFRRLDTGENPEVEVGRFLAARTSFRDTPSLEGSITYHGPSGEASTVGVLQGWLECVGDGWTYICGALADAGRAGVAAPHLRNDMITLGTVTAEFHAALASDATTPAFRPERVSSADMEAWSRGASDELARVSALVGRTLSSWTGESRRMGEALLAAKALPPAAPEPPASVAPFSRIRIHGDFHLGQTLKTPAGFALIDFEGEPAKPLAQRRGKACALRDVAGMLRSFEYAIETAAAGDAGQAVRLRTLVDLRGPFLDAYLEASARLQAGIVPGDRATVTHWLRVFELEKALYELDYEIHNRPTWVPIPLRGILAALS
jgi:maltose alpha-D-glucosyltransferase/alpha-amylase